MSNDEYQHQNSWKEEVIDIEHEKRLMLQDLMIWGECAYHYPSFKRIHPLDIIVNDNDNNI